MNKKILIYSTNPSETRDFFMQTKKSLTCLTTSLLWDDILCHVDIFKPDAFLIFVDQTDEIILGHARTIKSHPSFKGGYIFVMGTTRSCDTFSRKCPGVADLVMGRPTSPPIMLQHINKFFLTHPARSDEAAHAPLPKPSDNSAVSLDELMKSFGDTPPAGRKHIVVIDDDRTVLKLLKTALSDEYDVTTMVSGNMAMKFLETHTADLILLDYEMPVESGPEVFKKFKESRHTSKIPIIFLTGVADSVKIKEVLLLGPQGYLLKPINIERLKSTIKNVLAGGGK